MTDAPPVAGRPAPVEIVSQRTPSRGDVESVIVIGSGPAGLTAALDAQRYLEHLGASA